MGLPRMLVVVNVLAALALVIAISVYGMGDVGLPVSEARFAEMAKQGAPGFGLDVLAASAERWKARAAMLRWCAWGAVALIGVNAFFWATWRGEGRGEEE
jgi:hypothetical protein